jgi:hypothetical protein
MWRGVAYPLLDGSRIDVGTIPPETACGDRFAILSGQDATWVLMAGLPGALVGAKRCLEAAGIDVFRSGRWLGETVRSQSFDWFLRCSGKVQPESIRAALGEAHTEAESDDAPARVAVLEQRLVELRAELVQLESRLRAAAPASLPEPAFPEPARDVALEEALRQVRDLQARLDNVPLRQPLVKGGGARLMEELGAALAALRPDVLLLRDSLQVVVGEFAGRGGFYRALQELPPAGGRPDGWKALRGADRWWERHVSTGQDDGGRAYAQFDPNTRRWGVLLGWKAEQARDIEWLRRQR